MSFALPASASAVAGRTSTAVGWPASRLAVTRCCPIIPVPPITSMLLNIFAELALAIAKGARGELLAGQEVCYYIRGFFDSSLLSCDPILLPFWMTSVQDMRLFLL
jgi:hypothetical protein